MDIFNRYFGESECSMGQNFPQNIVFTDGKAVVDDEDGGRLILTYPHLFSNHPWRAEDMKNNKGGSDFTPAPAIETVEATDVAPTPTPMPPAPILAALDTSAEPAKDIRSEFDQPTP